MDLVVFDVSAAPSVPAAAALLAAPNPSSGQTIVRLRDGAGKTAVGATELLIYDVAGRLVRVVPVGPDGDFVWDQRDGLGRRVASGAYHGRLRHGGGEVTVRMAVVR